MAITSGSLTDTIVEIHEFLASLTDIKRLEMERDKAGKLARALNNANQHVKIPMLNSRNAALAILAWTAARIYVPMAKDVMAEMAGHPPKPAHNPVTDAVTSTPPAAPGAVVPVPTDDAALADWLPSVAN